MNSRLYRFALWLEALAQNILRPERQRIKREIETNLAQLAPMYHLQLRTRPKSLEEVIDRTKTSILIKDAERALAFLRERV